MNSFATRISQRLSATCLALLLGTSMSLVALPASADDLLDAYRLAKQNDPQIRAAEATFLAAAETWPQARAAYLPQISATASTGESTAEQTNDELDFNSTTGTVNVIRGIESSADTDSLSWSVDLRQSIFDWSKLKDFSRASAEVAKAEAEYMAAQQALMIRVSERYFDLLKAIDNLEANKVNRESIGQQLEQTRKRFDVGLIAITDVQESQAAYDRAVADEIAAQRQVNTSRERLRVVLGQYLENPETPVDNMPLTEPNPASETEWVDKAREQNLEVISNRFAVESADASVAINRAGHYPTLDLVAQRRYNETENTITDTTIPIPSTTRESETTYIGVQLNVPIFSGGATQSRVRQAAAQRSAAMANFNLAVSTTESNTRDAYLGVISEISRSRALKQAYESASTALKATQAGYEVGTRTAVDVLDARRAELQALVNWKSSRYDYLLNLLRLKQAAGTLSDQDIEQVASFMD
ncbi:MAG: TolC family outer membrane protein [Gammaproteobacteria bacterium]|nr:TolC family outer membrane protein [Gammaproteobacteria bacterium]